MFRAVVLFSAVLALTKGWTTPVNQCLNSFWGPLPINVYIAGCDTQPCSLEQGRDAVFKIIFSSPYDIHRMRTTAWFYVGLPLPYNLGERAETCNFLSNLYCPVVKNQVMLYTLNLFIEDFMPLGTQLALEIRIQDDSNRNIMCFRTIVNIVAPGNNKLGAQNSTITVEE